MDLSVEAANDGFEKEIDALVAEGRVDFSKMKPTVVYEGEPTIISWNFDTLVAYLDRIHGHPNKRLNGRSVRTSKVVSYDEATGRIETLNSIYIKHENFR